MTGIERLRGFARRMDELGVWPGGAKLLDIAEQIEREHDAEVADSPYDAILPEDRDALAWVRDHGGIDHVKSEWRSRVPYDRYVRRRKRLLGHIAECETALGGRREIISRLGHRVSDLTRENAELRRRAMPEGFMWPRYEDGESVIVGEYGVTQVDFYSDGLRTVWGNAVKHENLLRGERVRSPAVLAADDKPLEVGQTVWDTDAEADTPLTVVEVSSDLVRCEYTWKDGKTYRPCYPPDKLTHTKPEPPDSYCRLYADMAGRNGNARTPNGIDFGEFLRRCKALAEKENRNE